MDVLARIVEKKKDRLVHARYNMPMNELRKRVLDIPSPRDFKTAISRGSGPIRLIAEIKKASPSSGIIAENFNLFRIASLYEKKLASAISVLTEEDFFQGHLSYLRQVKHICTKPILRKDFLLDHYQIYESRAGEADALLLIAAILEKNQAADLLALSIELGMAVVFEVHDEYDLEKALHAKADIIGINNRNLKTLAVDLGTTLKLNPLIPFGTIVVSASGIETRADVIVLEKGRVDAILVGTSLMAGKAEITELLGSSG